MKQSKKNKFNDDIFCKRLIAFVGSEGSGKSTLSGECAKWLAQTQDVAHIHLGKPPRSFWTFIPWALIQIYIHSKRRLKKMKGQKKIRAGDSHVKQNYNPRPIVALLIAIDRSALLKRHMKSLKHSSFIVTDRFPGKMVDSIDGPTTGLSGNWLRRMLGRWEFNIYQNMTQPGVVFKAEAPLQLTLQRNASRAAPEPKDWIYYCYEQAKTIHFDSPHFICLDTTCSMEETMAIVKQTIKTLVEL